MSGNRLFALCIPALFVAWLVTSQSAFAQFTWDGEGGPGDTLMTSGVNWEGDVAPSITSQPSTSELHFGPGPTNTTVGHDVQIFADKIIFDAGAPAYTFTENPIAIGSDIAFGSSVNKLLVNNSSTLQSIGAAFNASGGTFQTPGAGLEFHGDYVYAAGSGSPVKFELTHDVTMNTRQLQSAARHVYGANGLSTTTSDPAGTLILDVASGTGSSNGSNFTGAVHIWSGAVRVGHADALGLSSSNSNFTFVHGTFATAISDAQAVGGFDHGFGRLEIYNGITLTERLRIDGRQGDAADFDHIVNVSGDNTISSGILSMGGAGHWNISSTSGKLTFTNDMSSSDPGQAGGATRSNSVWTFRGAGDIDFSGNLLADVGTGSENVVTALRKQGVGTVRLLGAGNTWEGGTLVEGGSLVVPTGGTFSASGARIHVASGATLDLSAISGLTVGANVTLSGRGSVAGNVTTNNALAKVSPGGTGSLDGSDAIAVTNTAGSLLLQNNLSMSAGGSYQWNLAALSTSNPGTDFDQLSVGGNLALGGTSALTLDFSLLGANGPDSAHAFWTSNHSWKVVDAATNTGGTNFGDLFNGTFSGGTFSTSVGSGADLGDIFLSYSANAGLDGDWNGDNVVDAADYVTWRNNPGGFPSNAYDLWREHFGDFQGSGTLVADGATSTPEPGSIVLAVAAAAGGLLTIRKRRSTGRHVEAVE